MAWPQSSSAGLAIRCAAAAVSVSAAATLISLFQAPTVPLVVAVLAVAFAAASAAWPATALLAVAALVPSIGWFGVRLHYTVAWPEALVVAFLAGWALHVALRRTAARLPPSIGVAAVLLAALVVASMLLDIAELSARLGTAGAAGVVRQYVLQDFYQVGAHLPGLHAGRLVLEGLGIFWAASWLSAGDSRLRSRLAAAVALGGTIAAVLTIRELWLSAQRSDAFWATFGGLIGTLRHNAHFTDLNAAGSQYVLLLFIAAAFALASRHRGAAWGVATLALVAGLWLSASRAAFFAAPVALALALATMLIKGRRQARAVLLGAAVLVVGGVVLLIYAPLRGNQADSSVAAQVRVEMARTSLRMAGEAPVFGVGVGQYPARSGEFSSPELIRLFPVATRENAHNQFLQILAELGVTGLATWLVLVGAALASGFRNRHEGGAPVAGALAGLAAFLITCLAGHPLLIPQVAFTFWIVLGLVVHPRGPSDLPAAPHATSRRRAAAVLAAGLLALAASIPPRATERMRNANLEHLGIGVSLWQTAEDGTRYREALGRAAVFVPNGEGFRFRLRAEAPHPVDVELHLARRLANIVTLQPGGWQDVNMTLNPDAAQGRFLRLEIVGPPGVALWMTKIEPIAAR
jgi:O-antigen ligase